MLSFGTFKEQSYSNYIEFGKGCYTIKVKIRLNQTNRSKRPSGRHMLFIFEYIYLIAFNVTDTKTFGIIRYYFDLILLLVNSNGM